MKKFLTTILAVVSILGTVLYLGEVQASDTVSEISCVNVYADTDYICFVGENETLVGIELVNGVWQLTFVDE